MDSVVVLFGDGLKTLSEILAIISVSAAVSFGCTAFLAYRKIPEPYYISKCLLTVLCTLFIFINATYARLSDEVISKWEFAGCLIIYTLNLMYQGFPENPFFYILTVIGGYGLFIYNYVFLWDTWFHRSVLCWIVGDLIRIIDEFKLNMYYLDEILVCLFLIPGAIEPLSWFKVPFILMYGWTIIKKRSFEHIFVESPFPEETNYDMMDLFRVVTQPMMIEAPRE